MYWFKEHLFVLKSLIYCVIIIGFFTFNFISIIDENTGNFILWSLVAIVVLLVILYISANLIGHDYQPKANGGNPILDFETASSKIAKMLDQRYSLEVMGRKPNLHGFLVRHKEGIFHKKDVLKINFTPERAVHWEVLCLDPDYQLLALSIEAELVKRFQ